MSAYISFYLKSNSGEFLPIASFSRSNVYYEYAEHYVPNYDVAQPLTKECINEILSDVREEQAKHKECVEKYEKKLQLIASMNNSVEEKMEAIHDCQITIDEFNELKEDLDNCEHFFISLLWMIEEAEGTKWYEDKSKVINPEDYIYAGIECRLPNETDE